MGAIMAEQGPTTDKADMLHGHCLCEAVSVRFTPPGKHIDACHCSMCRKWAGGPHMGLPMVTEAHFTGETNIERFASSDFAERGFCKTCGTHIFYYFKPQKAYSFPAGLFDGLEGFTMTEEIFIDAKPDYYDFGGERERLTEAQVMVKFAAAMENTAHEDGQ
jgi:hypothetical protein